MRAPDCNQMRSVSVVVDRCLRTAHLSIHADQGAGALHPCEPDVQDPLLNKLQHFTRLAEEERCFVTKMARQRVRRVSSREDIMREGESPSSMNLIREGWACRYKTLEDGRRQIIAFFLPGDICDYNVFVTREMDHSIAAITPVSVAEVSRSTFDEMLAKYP